MITDYLSLPETFSNLQKIKILMISNNMLRRLPTLHCLQQLELLDISNNRLLTNIPNTLFDLNKSCIIGLGGCQLPERISKKIEATHENSEYVGPTLILDFSHNYIFLERKVSLKKRKKSLVKIILHPPQVL